MMEGARTFARSNQIIHEACARAKSNWTVTKRDEKCSRPATHHGRKRGQVHFPEVRCNGNGVRFTFRKSNAGLAGTRQIGPDI